MTQPQEAIAAIGRDWMEITFATAGKLVELQVDRCRDAQQAAATELQRLLELRSPLEFASLQQEWLQRAWKEQSDFAGAGRRLVEEAWKEARASLQAHFAASPVVSTKVESNARPPSAAHLEVVPVADAGPAANDVASRQQAPQAQAAPTFELYLDRGGEHRFRLQDADGANVLASEGYKTRASAEKGIASVVKNAVNEARYDRTKTASGAYMFNLKAGNHQIVGTSRSYASADEMERDIEMLKQQAAHAETRDLTEPS